MHENGEYATTPPFFPPFSEKAESVTGSVHACVQHAAHKPHWWPFCVSAVTESGGWAKNPDQFIFLFGNRFFFLRQVEISSECSLQFQFVSSGY